MSIPKVPSHSCKETLEIFGFAQTKKLDVFGAGKAQKIKTKNNQKYGKNAFVFPRNMSVDQIVETNDGNDFYRDGNVIYADGNINTLADECPVG